MSNKKMNPNFKRIVCKQCAICGIGFAVKMKQDGFIETDCFHGVLNLHYFMGWTYSLDTDKEDPFKHMTRHYKNKFYKIVGFSHWSREVVYFIWKLFHRGKWHFWECPKCANRPDDV